MSHLCSDQGLISLSSAILSCTPSTSLTKDQKPLVLTIRKLKRFITSDTQKIVTWNYNTLKARNSNKEMTDPINQALLDLLKDCISFHEATNNTSPLDTLFDLVVREPVHMGWLLCLIAEKLPYITTPRLHYYLIVGLSNISNPFLATSNEVIAEDQQKLIFTADQVFKHLLSTTQYKEIATKSVITLFDNYFDWTRNSKSLTAVDQKYTLGYLLSLPKISPSLFDESWSLIFKRLYENRAAGDMFLFEKNTKSSVTKDSSGQVRSIESIFPVWLTSAFNANGLIMKHAMDVAIMLDTLTHDDRLELNHLAPIGDKSIMETLRPSFEKLDLKPTSIDLIDWVVLCMKIGRGVDDLSIPLFLLQLVVLKKNEVKDKVVDIFVQLIIRLDRPENDEKCNDGARYLILNLVSSTEGEWPGIFQLVLENIFSRAIAMHIVDSEGSVNVEKILGNLAMLFEGQKEDNATRPGFSAFKTYLASHWRQVLLLFLNHPSMECRAMGYRVLTNSRFWENTNTVDGCDPQTISKLLIDAWFRHMKGRYLRFGQEEELSVVDEQQRLIAYCCQNTDLAKVMLSYAMECILSGAVEIFPTVDVNALQQKRLSLYDKVVREHSHCHHPTPQQQNSFKKPPQFLTTIDFQKQDDAGFIDVRDGIYVDNIIRTAALFSQFSESPTLTSQQYLDINRHILNRLCSVWAPNAVSLDTYDDVLPKNIPYQSDIAIGNDFKDHPVLFIIFEKYTSDHYTSTEDYPMINEIIRSILVYFIVFWNMRDVASVPTTLKFATQLEETTRLLLLLKPVLPEFLVNSYHVFPFMSAKDLGDILFQVLWYYLRWSNTSNIPGIKKVASPTDHAELKEKCRKKLFSICENRLKVLETAPSWHTSLESIMSKILAL